jgi:leucyl-tRNA synthetase
LVREAVEATILLLSPVAPHITEECWEMLGHGKSLLGTPWPGFRADALQVDKRLVVIQINGKVRSRIEVPSSFDQKEIETEALKDERIRDLIGGKPIKKVIVVKNKLVNVVV